MAIDDMRLILAVLFGMMMGAPITLLLLAAWYRPRAKPWRVIGSTYYLKASDEVEYDDQ